MDVAKLLADARSSQPRAGDGLSRYLHERLWGFFLRRVDRQEVSDLVNNTAIVVLRELDGFELRDPGSFDRWLFVIAHNQLKNFRRKQRRAQAVSLDEVPLASPDTTPGLRLQRSEERELVQNGARRLCTPLREVIEHQLDDGEPRELAAETGIPATTLRSRGHRAREQVREWFERERKTPPR